jgi:hypothetical protein
MEVSGRLHTSAALPPGGEPSVLVGRRVAPRAGLEAAEKRYISPLPGTEPGHLSCSLVTITTGLSSIFSLYLTTLYQLRVKWCYCERRNKNNVEGIGRSVVLCNVPVLVLVTNHTIECLIFGQDCTGSKLDV